MSGGDPGAESSRQALAQFQNIDIPDIDKQKLALLMPEYLGDFQAQQEANIAADPSAMEGVSTDPRLAEAQMAALSQMSEIGQTGLLPGEQAALRQARRGAAGEAQAKSAQLMDDFARRGMGGSGAELAARLQAAQSSGDRLSQESDRTMQMAQERALNAIGQSSNMAGQIRGQAFGEQSDVARAKDAINQFNVNNQQSVQQRNIAAANAAASRNLGEKQRIGEAGAATQNQEQMANKDLIQQQFNNQMQRAGGMAGQYGQIASGERDAAGRQAQQQSALIGAGAGLAGNMIKSDARAKKDIKRTDMAAFLDELVPYSFKYKDEEKDGEGKQLGILAQDLEKSESGSKLVADSPEGKMVDYGKAGPQMMASLADLHQRLKELEKGKS